MPEERKPNQTPSPEVKPSPPEAKGEEGHRREWIDLITAYRTGVPVTHFSVGPEEPESATLEWLDKQQYVTRNPFGRIVTANEPDFIQAAELSKLSAQLTSRINEVVSESRLASERIAKDQEQITALTKETRAMLERLRA